ncbi:Vitamin B12 import ATP-binding protein BtuD [Sinobacterium norvegicum]|uniref:Vitamin B12 import ATP-binding protein BtuD n=1 Tax=Sinobacterium norvegicum TaxID=1641715 RepID=A0ABM9AIS2_9GAMM|nr:ATP-binding cassette domain-containing protein [Sinobacterium norvegicum]CAH0992971.1 Vitamin B12 import ATP-binding protein BtuD [Sinobacterium norvegicum]
MAVKPQPAESDNREVICRLHSQQLGHGNQPVLHDIDLTLYRGDHVAVLGASGVGKTTLLAKLYQQMADVAAYSPQQHGLVEALSAYNNIYIGGLERYHWLYNISNLIKPKRQDWLQISRLADDLAIADELTKSVDRLSGGQRQRVVIARALFQQRQIFIGDEPVAALDPVQAGRLLALIQQQHHSSICALHQRPLALQYCNRIIGLKQGAIAFDQPSSAVSLDDLTALYR